MNKHNNLASNKLNLSNKKSKVFIFRYDPDFSFGSMFKEFWNAVDGKECLVEPHVVRSDSIEVLSTSMNQNRLNLFATLVKKKPNNLTELASLLQKDYSVVRRDVRMLEAMGIIKLEKLVKSANNRRGINGQRVGVGIGLREVKPVALYERIIFDFPVSVEKPVVSIRSTSQV